MSALLSIEHHILTSAHAGGKLDMAARCAFALCKKGNFTIKILNDSYKVGAGSMLAGMPFVNIELLEVTEPSELIMGTIHIKDVPLMINRWINLDNMSAIQNSPHVRIDEVSFNRLEAMIGEYLDECERSETESAIELCRHIEQDLINYRIRLIVGEVLKILVTNVSMKPVTHTRRDYIFQQFMLSLYSNFRQHHNVGYYAGNSGVSQKYFSTVIRELSGSTPSEWIEIVVVAEAKSLLSDINLSIKDIAGMLNFPDAPTFSKYFARSTGQTPKAYRRTLSPLNAGKR